MAGPDVMEYDVAKGVCGACINKMAQAGVRGLERCWKFVDTIKSKMELEPSPE